MVSIDLYMNETTRHADLILPPCWALAEDHVELLAPSFSVRNVVRWCAAGGRSAATARCADWEILLRLAEGLGGGPTGMRWLDPRCSRVAARLGWRSDPEQTARPAAAHRPARRPLPARGAAGST